MSIIFFNLSFSLFNSHFSVFDSNFIFFKSSLKRRSTCLQYLVNYLHFTLNRQGMKGLNCDTRIKKNPLLSLLSTSPLNFTPGSISRLKITHNSLFSVVRNMTTDRYKREFVNYSTLMFHNSLPMKN